MAKQDTSEEKSQPASEKKLRDGRKKGQTSQSRDLISGFGLLAMVSYLLLTWPTISGNITDLMDALSRLVTQPFDSAVRSALPAAIEIFWLYTIQAVAILVFIIFIAGIMATRGPIFAFDPLKPNFEHISPAAGFKRIFSIKNTVEFGKNFLKMLILAGVLFVVLRTSLRPLFHIANCGEQCLGPMLLNSLYPIAAVAVFAFIAIGFLDMPLQRMMFLREMRMTKTEQKRERKDIEGDPLILGERRKERHRSSQETTRFGLPVSSVVIAGNNQLIGLLYHPQKAPLPIVVAKYRTDRVPEMRAAAKKLGIPIEHDEDLSRALATRHKLGDHLQQEYFAPVAEVLVGKGLT